MRIRWQGFELPSRFVRDETISTPTFGRFTVEPFERGFGTTIGNSLRRVLLSSLEGAAVVSIRIKGVQHEFSSVEGVLEDVTEIVLNVKNLVVDAHLGEETRTLRVLRNKAGEVRGGDVEGDASVRIVNPELLLCTLTADVPFEMELAVRSGRGYATADENLVGEQEVGVIPVDSIFSPVSRVRYRTEDTRVGQRTNYDRLVLDVWTRGTVTPEDAIVEAAKILRKHLNPFVYYTELGQEVTTTVRRAPAAILPSAGPGGADAELQEKLARPVSSLGLSARAQNCLDAVKVTTVGELASKTEAELLRFRSFGKTSLNEVKRKLAELGLELGGGIIRPGEAAADETAGGGALLDEASSETESSPIESGVHEPMEVFTMDDND